MLDSVCRTVREAGAMALRHFRPGEKTGARIWSKSGGSPVTEADIAVDTYLKIQLSVLMPDAAWLSEETADNHNRLNRRHVWVVDPIDGTRAFMSGHHDWAVCVGLLFDNEPVLGVVFAPAQDGLYTATSGNGARRNGTVLASSSHNQILNARVAGPQPLIERISASDEVQVMDKIPSLAMRIVRIAEDQLDIGLVTPDSRDWDLAAADLILREAGGSLTDQKGVRPRYNQPNPVHGVLAAAPDGLHPKVLAALAASRERVTSSS
jgi:myo-inositol-1(or 4)-monophosphatase